jgi:hypothetical protein
MEGMPLLNSAYSSTGTRELTADTDVDVTNPFKITNLLAEEEPTLTQKKYVKMSLAV